MPTTSAQEWLVLRNAIEKSLYSPYNYNEFV